VVPGDKVADETVLYKRGTECSTFSLVLQGQISVWAGQDAFHSDIGPWSTLGDRALLGGAYHPDFSAITNGSCRILQIKSTAFAEAEARVRTAKAAPDASNSEWARLNKTTRTASLLGASNGSVSLPFVYLALMCAAAVCTSSVGAFHLEAGPEVGGTPTRVSWMLQQDRRSNE
jgi:hypothetical protein